LKNPFEFIETVKHLPVISEDSYHEVSIKVQKEDKNLIPSLTIKFIINSTEFRIDQGYLTITDRNQDNLKEYKVDEGNFIYYNAKKEIASFLVVNSSFPDNIDPENLQHEMHNILGATKDKQLIQAYRVLCLYWSIVDSGLDMSEGLLFPQGPEEAIGDLTPPWE